MKWISALCLTVLSTGWQAANAACVEGPVDTLTCSGTTATVLRNDLTPSPNPPKGTINLVDAYLVDVAAGAAFQIINNQNIDINLNQSGNSSAKSAFGFMIQTGGSISQTINGNVTGKTQSGLATTIFADGGNLRIDQPQGLIAGQTVGLVTQNNGVGSTTISTSGSVTSVAGNGLGITNAPSSTDLTITQVAGQISAQNAGVAATNNGTGATVVSTAAGVKSIAGPGLSIGGFKPEVQHPWIQ